ncbi:hypothetical protein [Aquibium microcysteis]|uniref:hypothetical protein n=1 Tax=Aquibium microcysteis TaxID=675281 RepID=UPI00165D0EC4|nr:hypothetical protein [Aquibium microcysteis]
MRHPNVPARLFALSLAIAAWPAAAQQQPLGTQQPLGGARVSQPPPAAPQAVRLRFVNAMSQPVDYYRADPRTGQFAYVATIAPGASADQNSEPGGVWVFGVAQQEFQRHQAGPEPYQSLVLAPPGQQRPATVSAAPPGGPAPQGQSSAGVVVPPEVVSPPRRVAAAPTGGGGSFGPAASWGGVVRSGPGMENARLASLAEREPIELLENTGVMMNGYPWFRIRYRGQTGFQWGGIICGDGAPVPGTHEVCR